MYRTLNAVSLSIVRKYHAEDDKIEKFVDLARYHALSDLSHFLSLEYRKFLPVQSHR